MGARGINLAEEGHPVSILSPQNVTGGVTSTAFSLKNAGKANIFLQIGALSATLGAVTLNASTSAAGANPTAIPFTYYQQPTAGNANDTLALNGSTPSSAFSATSAGFVPANAANTFYVLVVQADQLPQGSPYLQLAIADGTDTDYVSALAVLTGLAFAGNQQPSATV